MHYSLTFPNISQNSQMLRTPNLRSINRKYGNFIGMHINVIERHKVNRASNKAHAASTSCISIYKTYIAILVLFNHWKFGIHITSYHVHGRNSDHWIGM